MVSPEAHPVTAVRRKTAVSRTAKSLMVILFMDDTSQQGG
jgi:hypothetical protein